jgi:hypothetical protein
VKQRAKVAKADAIARGVQLVADFESQLDAEYSFDQSAIWEAAMRSAATAVTDATVRVQEECERLGIPPEFAPSIQMGWASQGQQASKLRQVGDVSPNPRKFRPRPGRFSHDRFSPSRSR